MRLSKEMVYVVALFSAIVFVSAQTVHDHASVAAQLPAHDHALVSSADQLPVHSHAASSTQLPVSVNGAETPQLIPDDLAYRHFILSVAEHSAASSDDQNRRASRLGMTGLSQSDQSALVVALTNLREQLDAIQAARAATPPSNGSGLQQLLAQEASLLDNARAMIQSALSTQGAVTLNSYIQNFVKKGIVIYASN